MKRGRRKIGREIYSYEISFGTYTYFVLTQLILARQISIAWYIYYFNIRLTHLALTDCVVGLKVDTYLA